MITKTFPKFAGLVMLASTFLPHAATAQEIPEQSLSVTTAAQGGAWYGAAARILEEVVEVSPGLITQVQPGGAIQNVRRIEQGDTDLAMTMDFIPGLAYEGMEPFESQSENFSYLFQVFPGYTMIVATEESGVETFEDLFTARVSPGGSGWAGELMFRLILGTYDMDYNGIQEAGGLVNFVGTSDAVQMMRDGSLDAMFITGNPPTHPLFQELALTTPINLVEIPEEKLDELRDVLPFLSQTIYPEDPYPGVEGGFRTLGGNVVMVAHDDLSEEAAYTIVKTFYENLEELRADVPTLKEASVDNAVDGVTIPIHPGAERYYREIGLISDE